MKRFIVLMCFFVLAFPVLAQAKDEFVLPKGFAMALPKDGAVQAEWIAPPISTDQLRAANLMSPRFHMDAKGAVWMSSNRKTLADLASGMSFSLARPLEDFIFLPDGALFIVSDTALGLIPPVDKNKLSPTDPEYPFQPLCRLPVEKGSVVSDGKGPLYVYGYIPALRLYEVFELDKDFSRWHSIFVSAERIAAVSVNEGVLYIASGRMVFRLHPGDKEAKIVFTHPLESVTGVDHLAGTGLFYATHSGVGVVGAAALEFLKCPLPQIVIRDNALYVFMPESLGVLRLRNIDRLVVDPLKKKE
jgi:hypothetical protein